MFTKSIAIIDDDPDLLNLFSEALQMSGYNVSSFTDPRLAYQHIKANSTEYSLIIINDKMPKINALLLNTKLLEINPKLNVILLSNLKYCYEIFCVNFRRRKNNMISSN